MSAAKGGAAWSLRRRLAQGLVLTALLPMLLFGVALLWSQWQRDHNDLMLRLDANARLSATVIDDYLEAQLAGVRLLAEQAMFTEVGDRELASLLDAYPSMLRTLQVDEQGTVIAVRDTRDRRLQPLSGTVAGEDWFEAARDGARRYVSDAYRRPIYGNEVVVAVSSPMMREGRFAGALQAAIPVQTFARMSAESLARRNLELLILDRAGRVVYAGSGLRWTLLDDLGATGIELRSRAKPADAAGRVSLRDDMLRSGGSAYVDAVAMRDGWTLVLVAPRSLLLAPLVPRLMLLAVLVAISLVGVAWALWQQRRLLRRSIDYLLASLRGYALGGRLEQGHMQDMPEELQPLAGGIGELATRMNTAFDDLRQVLDEREHVIAERTASLRQAVGDLDRLSRTDALTGSLNYRGFLETAETLWREARASGKPLSVLALDIDYFKRYNDHYGHAEGDGALRRFAGAVRSALLHADDVLARPGGEEFIVFLPGSTAEQAMQVGERVCQRVRDADIVHAASPEGRVTVSVGVASLQPGDEEAEQMLRRADAALYRAKEAGRNRASA